ncbi:DUF1800 domain-containing protein [Sulfitobacter guttiformis]|uniref:Uncharacterized protein (DUF1800 family) n=1 Tax=Sulfitobacter guttiformis TaxID=74349 RepID=A0A420DMP6_9RHOB|nr:DUF1800 domain-containing protein [Sulfitobacter guttiformis]KIN72799.1 DUF1800 domain containing protein [Sulfitobacter guttiformis KCTC 32187]RKE95491.1 uncharacterized protein (DUF1800 family) [Sulfitobacter guttiformis]
MRFDPQLADIRFGCGLSPSIAPAQSAQEMLDTLASPDDIATRFKVETSEQFSLRIAERMRLTKIRRQNRGSEEGLAAKKAERLQNRDARIAQAAWMGEHLNRWVWTTAPLRERLCVFWADHFTATGKAGLLRRAATPYVETAIRPNIAGRFEDLLLAAVLHPLMLHYLDQERSVGPNSVEAARGGRLTGLNENLAREVIELHTLGVGAPYTQTDVTQLAELLTGLSIAPPMRLHFRKRRAEPGDETVLGKTYGGDNPHIRDIQAVLGDLARHPATARHIARKLAVHFVADVPDPDLVTTLETRFLETDGDLREVTLALLSHPAAHTPQRTNVKQPFHFMGSALRALGVPPEGISALPERDARRIIAAPLVQMGHIWEKPAGPDGLPEADSAWIVPQGIASRLQWAITVPNLLMQELPDPREFVDTALGNFKTPAVSFAATAAETRWDGIGLVLASPAFQRT